MIWFRLWVLTVGLFVAKAVVAVLVTVMHGRCTAAKLGIDLCCLC